MEYKPDYKIIGERIRFERELLGISREKFAEFIGLSPVFIGQIERGERKMSMDTLINISLCLHTSIDYLIFGKESVSKSADTSNFNTLISKCSNHELKIISDVIKVILPHIK